MVVGGSKIHERLAHFFIDVYTLAYVLSYLILSYLIRLLRAFGLANVI